MIPTRTDIYIRNKRSLSMMQVIELIHDGVELAGHSVFSGSGPHNHSETEWYLVFDDGDERRVASLVVSMLYAHGGPFRVCNTRHYDETLPHYDPNTEWFEYTHPQQVVDHVVSFYSHPPPYPLGDHR